MRSLLDDLNKIVTSVCLWRLFTTRVTPTCWSTNIYEWAACGGLISIAAIWQANRRKPWYGWVWICWNFQYFGWFGGRECTPGRNIKFILIIQGLSTHFSLLKVSDVAKSFKCISMGNFIIHQGTSRLLDKWASRFFAPGIMLQHFAHPSKKIKFGTRATVSAMHRSFFLQRRFLLSTTSFQNSMLQIKVARRYSPAWDISKMKNLASRNVPCWFLVAFFPLFPSHVPTLYCVFCIQCY